jgi:photosystem II stability/assembly factor-like uncharacterized protein
MNSRNFAIARAKLLLIAVALVLSSACHREVAVPPLHLRNITITDKFFAVWPTSPTRAFIGGSRGKLLLTEDGGKTFSRVNIGSDLAIFGIQMTDAQNGYLCGQDGLLMRTRDGGKTWERLNTRTHLYIFAMSFPDTLHGYLVGDQSLVLSTANGGETFLKRRLERIFPKDLQDYALPYMEPTLYNVTFRDDNRGWIVGEMGRIWATTDGGATWEEQQDSLLPQWHYQQAVGERPELKTFSLPTFFGVSFRDDKDGSAVGL